VVLPDPVYISFSHILLSFNLPSLFITQMLHGEAFCQRCCLLYSSLQFPVTSSLLCLSTLLSALFSKPSSKRSTSNFMKQGPSSEAERCSACQEIPHIFYNSECSLPLWHEPVTRSYPDPDQSSPYPPSHLFKIHFNIILPPTPSVNL